MNLKEALAHYLTLRTRVSEKFAAVEAKYTTAFNCQKGCHSCCKPGLTVSPIEAAAIQEFLLGNSQSFNPYGKDRCAFLTQEGACAVYEARPVVCRSHGAPLQVKEGDLLLRDVCPLNFKELDLREVPAEDILNLETLNTLLATVNIQAFGKKRAMERVALDPKAIREFKV